jgi:CRP-like cAMP-binding protein
MIVKTRTEELKKVHFFRGLEEDELAQLGNLCSERLYETGDMAQTENEPSPMVNFIIEGKLGAIVRIPGVPNGNKEIILDTLNAGDAFGWSSLISGTPWSTLKVLEPSRVVSARACDLVKLCDSDNHIGYVLMKNLSTLIASRLRRNRMSLLNTVVAIKGEG